MWVLFGLLFLCHNSTALSQIDSSSRFLHPRLIASFPLDQKSVPLGRVYGFAVDEKGYIYIPDSASAHIRIFDPLGTGIKTIGRKGGGPSEFNDPVRISIDEEIIVVEDVGLLKYIVFDREFNELSRFFYLLSGQPFIVREGKIVANEFYRKNERQAFRGVILSLSGKAPRGLLKQENVHDAWEAIKNSMAYIDMSNAGEIYLAKSGQVKIYKFDKDGNLIKSFGVQPEYYIPPQRTKDFEDMVNWGRAPQGREAGEKWYRSSSWVSGIYVLNDHLGIPIRTYNLVENKWECLLQFYDLDGNLLEGGLKLPELSSSSNKGFSIQSDHDQNIYVLEEIESDPIQYRFYHYRLINLAIHKNAGFLIRQENPRPAF